jgi:hypothetical protein
MTVPGTIILILMLHADDYKVAFSFKLDEIPDSMTFFL